jgi:hypothetical protein
MKEPRPCPSLFFRAAFRFLLRAFAEVDRDRRRRKRIAHAQFGGRRAHMIVDLKQTRVFDDAQHTLRQAIERHQSLFAAHLSNGLVFEEFLFRNVQGIGVNEAAAADSRAAHNQYVAQQSHAHNTVAKGRRGPEKSEHV